MRWILLFALGCGSSEPEVVPAPEGPVAGETPRAQLDRVKVGTDLSAIRTAIKLYRNDHEGEDAPDLDALRVSGLFYPDAYTYEAGVVRCDALPEL